MKNRRWSSSCCTFSDFKYNHEVQAIDYCICYIVLYGGAVTLKVSFFSCSEPRTCSLLMGRSRFWDS